MRETKIMTVIFGLGLAVVVVSLGMGIYTAIQQERVEEEVKSQPLSIPTPVMEQ